MCQSATRSCFAHELAGLYLNHQLVVVAKVVAVDVILLSPLHTKVRGRCSGRYYKLPRANKGSAIRCALRLKSPTVWHAMCVEVCAAKNSRHCSSPLRGMRRPYGRPEHLTMLTLSPLEEGDANLPQ